MACRQTPPEFIFTNENRALSIVVAIVLSTPAIVARTVECCQPDSGKRHRPQQTNCCRHEFFRKLSKVGLLESSDVL